MKEEKVREIIAEESFERLVLEDFCPKCKHRATMVKTYPPHEKGKWFLTAMTRYRCMSCLGLFEAASMVPVTVAKDGE